MKYANLFESCHIGKVKIKNKFFMAPMFPFGTMDGSGITTRQYSDYYVERARGGVGLIITGVARADNTAEVMAPAFTIVNDPIQFLQSTGPMVDRIHAFGTKIFMQIGAGWGRALWTGYGRRWVAPSSGTEAKYDPNIICEEITVEEIQRIIKGFIKTAVTAKMAGFDGVEIHAVHEGYLLDQFTMEYFNRRTDQYGGSFENRYRFAVEIVQGIKAACGKDFPVSLRYSPKHFMRGERLGGLVEEEFHEYGRDMEEGLKAAKYLVDMGYDALNVDVGSYDAHYWSHPTVYSTDALYLPFAEAVKKVVDVPVLCAGRMDDPELASRVIAEGKVDMIGLGRPLLADPYYPLKLQTGKEDEIKYCINCNVGCCGSKTVQIAHIGCAVNARCGYESEQRDAPKVDGKNMVIVGAGPGGMEAALNGAKRGFNVTLFEKSGSLGGNLRTAAKAEFKYRDEKLIAYYDTMLKKTGVNIKLNTEFTKETLAETPCDVLILATGATAVKPNIPGNETNNYYAAEEVLKNPELAGDKIVIVGGGQVGVETGIWLAKKGKTVSIVEMMPKLQMNAAGHVQAHANELIRFLQINAMTGTKVTEITSEGVKVVKGDAESLIEADTVIYSVGYRSNDALFNELYASGVEIYNIGDSETVAHVHAAVHSAFNLVNRL